MLSYLKSIDFNHTKLIFLLSIFLIPSLIAGPLITEIFLFLIFIIFILKAKFYKKLNLNIDKTIIVFFLLFYIYINLNTAFNSVSIDLSLKNTLFYFRFLFYSVIFFILINIYQEKFFNYFFYSIFIFLIFFFIDLLFLTTFENSISGSKFVTQRFSSLFGDELVMGGYIMKILPSLLICLIFLKKNNYFIFFILILSGILIVSSGERTSFAHFIILFFCLLIFKKFFKFSVISLILFSTIFTSLYFFKFYPINRIVNATFSEFKIAGRDDFIVFSDVHENMILTSLEIFKKNIFFGTGAKTYRFVCGDEKYSAKIKEKIINENNLLAKHDGKLFVQIFRKINNVTLQPHKEYIMNIFYENGEEINYNLFRYKKNIGVVGIAEKKLESLRLTTSPIIFFKKNDVLARVSYERNDGCDTHPHNLLSQIAAELGLFGLLFYLFFYGYLIKEFFRVLFKKQDIYTTCYYLSIISILINFIPILPSGNFFNNWYSFLLFVPFGFFMFFNQKIKKSV